MHLLIRLITSLSLVSSSLAMICYDPSPAFPVPKLDKYHLSVPLEALQASLTAILKDPKYDGASASIEVTSTCGTLWSYYHTARTHNESRPGTLHVNGNSQYRIASVTKLFTVLALLQLHAAGKVDINDPVDKYIPELTERPNGKIPWKDITVRAMASQLSGLPREFGFSDLLSALPEPWQFGLPPESEDSLPPCFRKSSTQACNTSELLDYAKTYQPVFAPNQQSSYSNLNFELLGIVIQNVSGLPYNEYIESTIFEPLNMSSSTLKKPSDENAVILNGKSYWDVDFGALSPTGGIYSSASDLSKFLRYTLAHYNALVTGINWFQPASFAGLQTAYGMPWEIFRTADLLQESRRPVTFVVKTGSVPGYYSHVAALPEYGLGITVLVSGSSELVFRLAELVNNKVVQAAEAAVWTSIQPRYAGSFESTNPTLNSSAVISTSASRGIVLEQLISNSTDVVPLLGRALYRQDIGGRSWHLQLIPTMLFKNESSQQGEIFRLIYAPQRNTNLPDSIWDGFCLRDVDTPGTYAGLPFNEVIFWQQRDEIEFTAFRVVLKRKQQTGDAARRGLHVQPADGH